MFLHRSRMQLPALIGALFLLFTGAADAFGIDACARHEAGHDHGSPIVEGGAPGDAAPSAEDPHAGHAGHGDAHEHEHEEDAEEAEDSRCDCRFLCLGGAPVFTPEAVVLALPSDPILPTAIESISTDLVGIVAQSLRPYFLPFPNAPPSHS